MATKKMKLFSKAHKMAVAKTRRALAKLPLAVKQALAEKMADKKA